MTIVMCKTGLNMIPQGYVVRVGDTFASNASGSGFVSDLQDAHVFADAADAERVRQMWFDGGHNPDVHGIQVVATPATFSSKTVPNAEIYQEGRYWRWRMLDDLGHEVLSGGNFPNRTAAEKALEAAHRAR